MIKSIDKWCFKNTDGLEIEGCWRVLVESIPSSESTTPLCTDVSGELKIGGSYFDL